MQATSAMLMQALLEDEKHQFSRFLRMPQCCPSDRSLDCLPPFRYQAIHVARTQDFSSFSSSFQRRVAAPSIPYMAPSITAKRWWDDQRYHRARQTTANEPMARKEQSREAPPVSTSTKTEKSKLKFSISAILSSSDDEQKPDDAGILTHTHITHGHSLLTYSCILICAIKCKCLL